VGSLQRLRSGSALCVDVWFDHSPRRRSFIAAVEDLCLV
jgi:hypothetical protein